MSAATKIPHIEASLKGRRVNITFDRHPNTIEGVTVLGQVWIGSDAYLRVAYSDGRRSSIKASAILVIEELEVREDEEVSRE